MITSLSQEQKDLMPIVVKEYVDAAHGGDDSINEEYMKAGIEFMYRISDMKMPKIVVCDDPLACCRAAGPGVRTIDSVGCGADSGWTAAYDYFQRIGIKYRPEIEFDTWMHYVRDSGVYASVLTTHTAFVSRRPICVHTLPNGRLHCETGKAIYWRSGYGVYALNGVRVPETIVMTPAERLDCRLVVTTKNAEVRREIVRKIGIERVTTKLRARVLDTGIDYANNPCELLGLEVDGGVDKYIKLQNPSVFGIFHVEGVSNSCKTVNDALHYRKPPGLKAISIDDEAGEDWYEQGDVVIWPRNAKSVKSRPIHLS